MYASTDVIEVGDFNAAVFLVHLGENGVKQRALARAHLAHHAHQAALQQPQRHIRKCAMGVNGIKMNI